MLDATTRIASVGGRLDSGRDGAPVDGSRHHFHGPGSYTQLRGVDDVGAHQRPANIPGRSASSTGLWGHAKTDTRACRTWACSPDPRPGCGVAMRRSAQPEGRRRRLGSPSVRLRTSFTLPSANDQTWLKGRSKVSRVPTQAHALAAAHDESRVTLVRRPGPHLGADQLVLRRKGSEEVERGDFSGRPRAHPEVEAVNLPAGGLGTADRACRGRPRRRRSRGRDSRDGWVRRGRCIESSSGTRTSPSFSPSNACAQGRLPAAGDLRGRTRAGPAATGGGLRRGPRRPRTRCAYSPRRSTLSRLSDRSEFLVHGGQSGLELVDLRRGVDLLLGRRDQDAGRRCSPARR